MKKILFVGDSLGMSRPEVELEQTYSFNLSRALREFYFISKFKRGNNTLDQCQQQQLLDDIIWVKPDYVIIQLGIVDCAPRLFTKREQSLLNKLPNFISRKVIKFFSNRRFFFTKSFKKVYVNISQFEKAYESIINEILKVKATPISVLIADTNNRNIGRSFGIKENIDKYNSVIKRISKKYSYDFVDYQGYDANHYTLEDGIHLNEEGNRIIYQQLLNYFLHKK